MWRSGKYLAVALVMMLATASASDASRSGRQSPGCSPLPSRVLTVDARAKVYQVTGTLVRGCEIPGTGKIFGRVRGSRRAYLLEAAPFGTTEGIGGLASLTLAGTTVAYENYFEDFGPGAPRTNMMEVRNLRTGRLIHRVPMIAHEYESPPDPGSATTVLKPDGAVAWIVLNAGEYEVHVVDRAGSRVLAVGSDIEPHSLTLDASKLHWTQGGEPMSASLS